MPEHIPNESGGLPVHTPRVLAAAVDETLTAADLRPLPDGTPRGTSGLRTAQMKDAVLVLCSAPGAVEASAMREQARRALREGGFMVKDATGIPGMFYVIGRQ